MPYIKETNTGKNLAFHYAGNEQDSCRNGQISFKCTLLRKCEILLYISCYRKEHNFSASFLDISSAVFIRCSVCRQATGAQGAEHMGMTPLPPL